MFFIDTHAHLYVEQFENDYNAVIAKALDEGIQKIIFPAIDSSTHEVMLKIEKENPTTIQCMMGLHPCSVKDDYQKEIDLVEQYLHTNKFVAIGEIGLDFYWDKTFIKQQLAAFNHQMELALQYKLPINIHTRNATQETIEAVKPFAKRGLTGIFHCFGGSYETAKQIIQLGFKLGIGGVVTYPKAGLQDTLKHVELEHIVLETDAPYLTPVPFRGKRNESSYIKIIAQQLAEIKGESIEEIAFVTTENAKKIYGC
ncbi:MAG: TatD family hydrolase [Chitinophagaceae bacterium]